MLFDDSALLLWGKEDTYSCGLNRTVMVQMELNEKSKISLIFCPVVTFINFEKSILKLILATFKNIVFLIENLYLLD